IQVMTNHSRDWVIMKLPLRVTYDTDVERVRKLIKNLGVELLDDPALDHLIDREVAFRDLPQELPSILAPDADGIATIVTYD
ncbi:MAG: hypothetical protein ACPGSI_17560, partial [Pikeienuella sp.]